MMVQYIVYDPADMSKYLVGSTAYNIYRGGCRHIISNKMRNETKAETQRLWPTTRLAIAYCDYWITVQYLDPYCTHSTNIFKYIRIYSQTNCLQIKKYDKCLEQIMGAWSWDHDSNPVRLSWFKKVLMFTKAWSVHIAIVGPETSCIVYW